MSILLPAAVVGAQLPSAGAMYILDVHPLNDLTLLC